MADVFISYKRGERDHCRAIAEALHALGYSVWFDAELEGGQHFPDVINREVRASKCVLVLWSRAAVGSAWVKAEATAGLQANKLVAATLERVELPVPFNTVHSIALGGWNGDLDAPEWREVLRAISRHVDRTEPLHAPDAVPSNVRTRIRSLLPKRRRGILMGVAAVLVVAAIAGMTLVTNLTTGPDTEQGAIEIAESTDAPPVPPGFQSGAPFAAIMDGETGTLMYCRNCDIPISARVAAVLMTQLLAVEALRAGSLSERDTVPVSEAAWLRGPAGTGAHMWLRFGEAVTIAELMRGVAVVGALDAATALAEAVAGSERAFAQRMNERARELGLSTASFSNPVGEGDGNRISAADALRLARFFHEEYPEAYALFADRQIRLGDRSLENRNPLLASFPGADGMTTFHVTSGAAHDEQGVVEVGYGLIGSAQRGAERRFVFIAGMEDMASRAVEARSVMQAAFYEPPGG